MTNIINGLICLFIGLCFIIFKKFLSELSARLVGFRREIGDIFWKNRQIKSKKYDPKDDYTKAMIAIGIFYIILAILFLTGLTKYFSR